MIFIPNIKFSLFLDLHLNKIYAFRMNSRITGEENLYLLTYSTEQGSSWEANRYSASQEIYLTLRSLKVHYRV
jgi:hypothetical protein